MINQTVSINNFSGLLKDEELPAGDLQTVLLVLSEISQKQDHFQANTSELVQLAAQHSPTFRITSRTSVVLPLRAQYAGLLLHRSAERRRGGGMGKTQR